MNSVDTLLQNWLQTYVVPFIPNFWFMFLYIICIFLISLIFIFKSNKSKTGEAWSYNKEGDILLAILITIMIVFGIVCFPIVITVTTFVVSMYLLVKLISYLVEKS